MKAIERIAIFVIAICLYQKTAAQNPHIRCYFNHPVNTVISTGLNAAYLDASFPDTIAAYIDRAKFTIDIALYNYTGNSSSRVARIATAVNAATARGVLVRWIYDASTSNTAMSLLNSSVHTFPSLDRSGYIMHNKFMVIDVNAPDSNDAVMMTGSYNWSDQMTTGDYNNIVFIRSKQVALAFYNEFNKMWGDAGIVPNASNSKFSTRKTPSTQTHFNVNGTPVEVYFSPKDSAGVRLEDCIRTANYDLFFSIYAFTDYSTADLIKTKYNNGINTRGIIDEFSDTYSPYDVLQPVLGNNMLVLYSSNIYHNKIMLVDALNPSSDPQVFTGSFNWSSAAQFSNDENAIIIHDAAIANQYYQSLCKNFTDFGGAACVAAPCPAGSFSIASNIKGSSYQWQVNTDSGFTNISNNANYTGAATDNLTLMNTPTSWHGYQYRCVVDGTAYSTVTNLTFTAYWNGSASTAWEDPANWNCGALPDVNTDVIINDGVKFFPTINTSTACRSLKLSRNTRATLANNITLMLMGR